MDLDRERLLGIGRFEREALGRTVQYTPPELWAAESPREGWRVKDVLAHLAAAEVAAAAIAGDEIPSEVEEYRKGLEPGRPFVTDEWNRWTVERRRDVPAVSLGLEWGRAADLLLARVATASAQDWANKEVAWVAGDLRLRYLVQARMAEWWVHGEDIREGGHLPPRREHWPIYVVNDLAIRLIPYSLSIAGQGIRGKTVEIELDGVGEGLWRRRTDPSDEPAAKPDAYITGEGYAFASVAGGRADVDVCLYEGLLNTGGEVDVAEAVLGTLRSFP